jgi:diguanylate cyclase (GGDEF)-like protein/PAS domain S-box-containing protein
MTKPPSPTETDKLRQERRTRRDLEKKVAQLTRTNDLLQKEIRQVKALEEAFWEHQRFLRAIVDGIQDPVYVKDRDGRIIFGNAALAQVVGKPLEEIIGKTGGEYFNNPPVWLALREHDLRVMESGQGYCFQEQVPTPGGIHTFISTKTPYRDASGEIIGIIGISRDSTDSTHAGEALQESEEKFRRLFALESDALFLIDQETETILEANDAACAMYGYAREELLRMKAGDVSAEPEESARALKECHERIAVRLHKKKNRAAFVADISASYFTLQGRPVLLAAVRDVTERKMAEEKLRETALRLSEAADLARTVYWEYDEKTEEFIFNDAFYDLYRTTVEQEGGYRMSKWEAGRRFVYPDDLEELKRRAETRGTRPGAFGLEQYEHRGIRRDGSIIHALVRHRPVLDEHGRVIKTIGMNQDITERKKMEDALEESENKFRALVENAIVGVYLIQDHVFKYANSKCAEIHGYADPRQMEGLEIRGTFFHEDLPPVEKTTEWVAGEGETQSRRFRIVRRDGKVRHVETFGRYTTYRGREAVIGMIVDITDRRKAEEDLRWKTIFLEALVDSSQDGLLVLDDHRQRVLQNTRLGEIWKMPPSVADTEGKEQRLNFFMASLKNPDELRKKLMHLDTHPQDSIRGEFELKDGAVVEAFSYPVLGKDNGEQYGRIWTFRDITEIRHYWDMLEELSTTDGLTGIGNRRRFDQFLEGEWHRSMRDYSELSLLLLDIDHFKQFNDRYGHLAGDDCLRQIASVLSGTVKRAGDLVARYGGEEFACVLPATAREGALRIAGEIANEIGGLNIPHEDSPVAGHVTVSIGVATAIAGKGREYSDLLKEADQCLYYAKQQGRNRVTALPKDCNSEVERQ